ncbi:hypothetical protein, partial [Curtobacterium citreum]
HRQAHRQRGIRLATLQITPVETVVFMGVGCLSGTPSGLHLQVVPPGDRLGRSVLRLSGNE